MPLNEAYGFHRSNLTKEQRRAAEAAVYGQPVPNMPTTPLSDEDIERFRTLVAQHDARGTVKEFDLNNPPQVPYTYQPFPTTVYHHATKRNKIVPDQRPSTRPWLKDEARADPFEPPPEIELDAATKEEAAAVDKEAKSPRSEPCL
jgi:hypothetical protein